MSLSIYDPIKNCFVLRPMTQPTINAFHPDYVKTYMPEFLSNIRIESTQYSNGVINGGKSKASREAKKGKTVNSINANQAAKESVQRVLEKAQSRAALEAKKKSMLDVKQYFTFARAGLPKGVKK